MANTPIGSFVEPFLQQMFSNKLHINLLTAHLLAHRIEDAVVCPGSRNAAIVHNFLETKQMHLHAVTDERSAAFVGIGLWLKKRRPIVVCVTSGSAVLNTLPGVAEAALRHIPLIIVSADRPPQWIGQLDGQTLPQQNALSPYAQCWQLLEPTNDEERWWCERILNEALLVALSPNCRPIQINIPISEPLFDFTTPQLPTARCVSTYYAEHAAPIPQAVVQLIANAKLPVLIVGQWEHGELSTLANLRDTGKLLVYAEDLSGQGDTQMAKLLDNGSIEPDLVIQIGGTLVSKHFKLLLRRLPHCSVIRIAPNEEIVDTFCHLETHIVATPECALQQLSATLLPNPRVQAVLAKLPLSTTRHEWNDVEAIFLGNSMTVRWGNAFFAQTRTPIYGNRGTNGIEGSLSVAAGYALAATRKTLCILGDLSFFYDVNALWNNDLRSQLRILLVNNGCGEIFYHLPGMTTTPALNKFIAANHHTTARGIADSYSCTYSYTEVPIFSDVAEQLIEQLLATPSERPVILEVFTQKF